MGFSALAQIRARISSLGWTRSSKQLGRGHDFGDDLDSKESACSAGDLDSIPGSGRSPGEGNGYPLQYFYLENSMDREPRGIQSIASQRAGHD